MSFYFFPSTNDEFGRKALYTVCTFKCFIHTLTMTKKFTKSKIKKLFIVHTRDQTVVGRGHRWLQ